MMKAKRKNAQIIRHSITVPTPKPRSDHFNEAYSANSTDALAVDGVESFKLTDSMISFGPWLGVVILVCLKALPIEERKKVLAVISPFRSGIKSVGVARDTEVLMGMSGLATDLAKGLTSGVGIVNGIFMIKYLLPNIAAREKSFKEKIELNQLLAKHLEKHSR